MTFRYLYGMLASPWYRVRPIAPQYRSREAWIEYCRARGQSPDGLPLVRDNPSIPAHVVRTVPDSCMTERAPTSAG